MIEKTNKTYYLISSLLVIVLIYFDQLTKYFAITYLKNNDDIIVVQDIFKLRYLENRGGAFGMLQGKQMLFLITTTILLGLLIFIYKKTPWETKFIPLRGCMVLLLSGAIGNMIDRVYRTFVVDFLYFELIDFPIFNIADIYITVSIIIFILLILFYYSDKDLAYIGTYNGKI